MRSRGEFSARIHCGLICQLDQLTRQVIAARQAREQEA
jgi:hypothetical protein